MQFVFALTFYQFNFLSEINFLYNEECILKMFNDTFFISFQSTKNVFKLSVFLITGNSIKKAKQRLSYKVCEQITKPMLCKNKIKKIK